MRILERIRAMYLVFSGNSNLDKLAEHDRMHTTNWLVAQGRETMTIHRFSTHVSIKRGRQEVKYISFLNTNISLIIEEEVL